MQSRAAKQCAVLFGTPLATRPYTLMHRSLFSPCHAIENRRKFCVEKKAERKRWLSTPSSGLPGMEVGDEFELERTFSQEDVDLFSRVSMDANPLHTEGDIANSSIFAKPVVHGMLVASMFSAVIGNNFPGSIYLSQKLKFSNPTLVGDTIVAHVKVLKLRKLSGLEVASMSTVCRNKSSGEAVVEGEAMCQLPSRPASESA